MCQSELTEFFAELTEFVPKLNESRIDYTPPPLPIFLGIGQQAPLRGREGAVYFEVRLAASPPNLAIAIFVWPVK